MEHTENDVNRLYRAGQWLRNRGLQYGQYFYPARYGENAGNLVKNEVSGGITWVSWMSSTI